jgi:hypothetical protein
MVGAFVFTQHDRTTNFTKPDAIAVGDYNIDAHMAQRVVLANGSVTNEGCLSGFARSRGVALSRFDIPYRVLLPIDVGNLLVRTIAILSIMFSSYWRFDMYDVLNFGYCVQVTAAVSGSHVGSASLRLEPQYMGMGHAAGVAAAMVVNNLAPSVQAIPVDVLQRLLTQQGVELGLHPSHPGSNDSSFVCGLKRCTASPGGGYNTSTCGGACQPLGQQEWIGSVGAWDFDNASGVAGALPLHKLISLRFTHLSIRFYLSAISVMG